MMRMMRQLALLALAMAFVGCKSEVESPAAKSQPAKSDKMESSKGQPAAAATSKKKKKKRFSVAPGAPPRVRSVVPPRPEGEPTSNEKFDEIARNAEQGKKNEKPGAPPVERLADKRFRVGAVVIDQEARTLEIPGRLNMKEGILEYFAVSTQGKLHESVLELFAEPSHIHLGLILIGLQPSVTKDDPELGQQVIRNGDRVRLFVSWEDAKTKKKRTGPGESWMYNRKTRKAANARDWIFQGSGFWNGRYGADIDRSVIALVPDGSAVLSSTDDEGNPYHGDSLGFEVHKKIVPPVGTPLTLMLKAISPKPADTPPQ